MKNIQLDITKAAQFLNADAIAAYEPQVKAAQEALENGTCPGNDFLGWLHLPSSITPEFIAELNATAQTLRENCEVVVVAGIGGSYLGARTVIEALGNSFQWLLDDKKNPVISGAKDITAEAGSTIDLLGGVTAKDTCGNDITDKIEVLENVDTNRAGIYKLTYSVTDVLNRSDTVDVIVKIT